jgi:hypothetical protein
MSGLSDFGGRAIEDLSGKALGIALTAASEIARSLWRAIVETEKRLASRERIRAPIAAIVG